MWRLPVTLGCLFSCLHLELPDIRSILLRLFGCGNHGDKVGELGAEGVDIEDLEEEEKLCLLWKSDTA